MNKLEGFLELKRLALPSVPWQRYTGSQILDAEKLWTVRVAVIAGNDYHLPRKVGVSAKEAVDFAKDLLAKLNPEDYIIYYPYFIAEKSGTLEASNHRTIIEAVDKDLWNLLTHNRRDVTVVEEDGNINYYGNTDFLSPSETSKLLEDAKYIRRRYRSNILEGAMLLEWSFAYECNTDGSPKGARKLVYIELRNVKK